MFEGAADLEGADWAQPAIFAFQGALLALWRSVGVAPEAVLGHSLGELSAAHAAGVFGFEEGLRFASQRGALLGSLPRAGRGSGGMAAVFAPLAEVETALSEVNAGARGSLDVAAENGTHQVVSGPRGLLRKLSKRFRDQGSRVEPLFREPGGSQFGRGSHSGRPFGGGVAARVRVARDSTGDGAHGPSGDFGRGGGWVVLGPSGAAHSPLRRGGGFAGGAGVRGLDRVGAAGGYSGPWRRSAGRQGLPGSRRWSGSQGGAEAPGDQVFAEAVSRAYEAGLPVAFAGLFAGEERRRVSLPAYPFQRRRHWIRAGGRPLSRDGHRLLGTPHRLGNGEFVFETHVSAHSPQWLEAFRIQDLVLAPARALWGASVRGRRRCRAAGLRSEHRGPSGRDPAGAPGSGLPRRRAGTDPRPAGGHRAPPRGCGPHLRGLQPDPRRRRMDPARSWASRGRCRRRGQAVRPRLPSPSVRVVAGRGEGCGGIAGRRRDSGTARWRPVSGTSGSETGTRRGSCTRRISRWWPGTDRIR